MKVSNTALLPPKKGPLVVVNSVPGSGSTFVRQVSQLLRSPIKHSHKFNERASTVFVIVRDIRDCICTMARRAANRDPGEKHLMNAANSLLRRKPYLRMIRKRLREESTVLIKYEEYLPDVNPHGLIRLIADQLGVLLSDAQVSEIFEQCSLEANRKRSEKFSSFKQYDRQTNIHGMHITGGGKSGKWQSLFTPKVCRYVAKHGNRFLVEMGYEENQNWVS